MWVYKCIMEDGLRRFEVGWLDMQGGASSYTVFQTIEVYTDREDARRAVNYLNGGPRA